MRLKCNINADLEHSSKCQQDEIFRDFIRLYNIPDKADKEIIITAEWQFPILDITGRWHPSCRFDRSIKADWAYGEKSLSAISAPVVTFFNENGANRGTYAVSETLKEVKMRLGVHEEDGTMKCEIQINLGKYEKGEYSVSILRDLRDIPYEKAIREVGIWWEESCGFTSAEVPDDAKNPMYSFWYSFHQQFTEQELVEECRRAKEMGFKTVIVDDGWQTDDTNRGYGYCGDWKPAVKKIQDMKKHVNNVHSLGMKYLLWFSVPYVGIYSDMWKLFHKKLIAIDKEQNTGILDIRYPDVRKYLSNIYANAVKEWGLDGLKLDFIDEFYERPDTPAVNKDMDCSCLQEALDRLLNETIKELKCVNPDILIEFRQRYIGPAIRQYGNMLRVSDCPESGLTNRVGIIDLRLLSGRTAVHSDPVMWHWEERPEIAALQIIDCLFATLQFSVKLDKISEEQKQMTCNYMNFMQKYKKLLQETPIEAREPHNLYPEARVGDENTVITVLYSANRVVSIQTDKDVNIIVNGTQSQEIYIKTDKEIEAEICVIDCYGKEICKEIRLFTGIQCISGTIGGRVEIRKRR